MEVILMKINDTALECALNMYVGEPCRICGKPITGEDLDNHAVFAGYSKDNKSRSAHSECWAKNIPAESWVHK
jgi:hypothetical protein